MKSPNKLMLLFILALTMAYNKGKAQESKMANNHFSNFIFDADSISGFDEQSASATALEYGCYGAEYKVFMYRAKRKFIIQKYDLRVVQAMNINNFSAPVVHINPNAKINTSSGSCTNDDFEDATSNPGPQIGGAVNGWVLYGGTNASYCNPVANGATSTYTVFNAPTIDPIMTAPNNTVSSYFDATNINQPAGSCFIRLNNDLAGAKVVRASKTYTISPTNALFRYAYRAVISDPSHPCCDQPGFHIKVTITNTTTNASTLLACPNISVAAGSACGPPTPGFVTGNLLNGSPSSYNPNWVPGSLDLSAYIGYAVTLNVFAIDCNYSGHAGYVYFDALCAPMTIIGNGTGFPAGTPQITLPTCGASGATITAPPGLGPYSWNSSQITIPANLTVPSNTNQTLMSNQSGTVQLTMNPPGSCQPINKIITVTITPAPVALATATQASCSNTLSAASVTTAGSASVSPVIQWSSGTVASNSLSATGLAVGITTITVTDNNGCQTSATVNILATPPPVTFAVNNLTGSYVLTCTNPTINLATTSNYTYGTISYNWSSTSFTASGPTASIAQTGTYNVCGIDAATSCSSCSQFTIAQDITVPTSTVSPITQVINCTNATSATFTSTVLSPTVNFVTNWYSPVTNFPAGPPSQVDGNQTSIYSVAGIVGTHTVQVCNTFNGCCNTKTVSVTSTAGFPTFQPGSTTNFSVGCVPLNQTTLCINNAQSVNNAAVQYAYLVPTSTLSVPLPAAAFAAQACTVTPTPGTWTFVVLDPSNGCQTGLPVQVIQNTVAPHVVAAYAPASQTLTCFNPTILATGSSTTTDAIVTWQQPSLPQTVSTNTIVLGPPSGPPTSTSSLVYANYTVVATNSVNACKTLSTVVVSQNFKAPIPQMAIGNPSVINCNGNPVVFSFTNLAVTSGTANGGIAQVYQWAGPSPQPTLAGFSTYSGYVAGVYTLTVRDSYNGCLGSVTSPNIPNVQTPPVIAVPNATAPSGCGSPAPLTITLSQSLPKWSVYFTEHPAAAAFTPSTAIQPANSPTYTGASATVTVDLIGHYEYVITNMQTGCRSSGTFEVGAGILNASFSADPVTGYAPLGVGFNNTSATSAGATNSVTSVWAFGNGTSSLTPNPSPSTTYTAPGTYTVMMISTRGGCTDTAYQVIRVDIPSKLEIPNVFTPNGDGSNDLFFLHTTNISNINAVIFDRWGNKVYDVTSETGNIGWDGKNQEGKECPSGTYFYIIKSTGKDAKAYEQKGNVSLYR